MCLGTSSAAGAPPGLTPADYLHVPVVAALPRAALLTSAIGYGFTESQVDAPGSHHRLSGRIAATLTPLQGLDFGLGTHLRHDIHPGADSLGSDQGTVLSSDLSARVGERLGSDLHLGLGLSANFPGGASMARSLEHPALDAQLLAAYLPEGKPWNLGVLAGFRLRSDRVCGAGPPRLPRRRSARARRE